jgi:hypothetical protein
VASHLSPYALVVRLVVERFERQSLPVGKLVVRMPLVGRLVVRIGMATAATELAVAAMELAVAVAAMELAAAVAATELAVAVAATELAAAVQLDPSCLAVLWLCFERKEL